jgi:hypothetical protein
MTGVGVRGVRLATSSVSKWRRNHRQARNDQRTLMCGVTQVRNQLEGSKYNEDQQITYRQRNDKPRAD